MESYFERVVDRLTEAGFRWYETANFCRASAGRDLRSRHNLAYWRGRDYLGLGDRRRLDDRRPPLADDAAARALPRLAAGGRAAGARARGAAGAGAAAPSACCSGLRLDEPLSLAGLGDARRPGRARAARAARPRRARPGEDELALTERGRFLGGGVTAELLA